MNKAVLVTNKVNGAWKLASASKPDTETPLSVLPKVIERAMLERTARGINGPALEGYCEFLTDTYSSPTAQSLPKDQVAKADQCLMDLIRYVRAGEYLTQGFDPEDIGKLDGLNLGEIAKRQVRLKHCEPFGEPLLLAPTGALRASPRAESQLIGWAQALKYKNQDVRRKAVLEIEQRLVVELPITLPEGVRSELVDSLFKIATNEDEDTSTREHAIFSVVPILAPDDPERRNLLGGIAAKEEPGSRLKKAIESALRKSQSE